MTGSRLRSFPLFALVAVALVACGANNTDTSATNSGPTVPASVAAPTSPEASVAGGSSPAGGAGAPLALSDRASKAMDQDFTISYAMNGSPAAASSMTVYWEASTKNWRVDMDTSAGTITLMQVGRNPIYCLEAQKTCTKSGASGQQTSQIPFFSQGLTDPGTLESTVTDQLGADASTTSKRIAGTNTTCYESGSSGTSGEICFADDGLILAWTGTIGGQRIELVATKAQDSVSGRDFKPPYKVEDFGNVLPP
jgi:hypothetical protein